MIDLTAIQAAMQEFEDEAFHHSMHHEVSDTAKTTALAVLKECAERREAPGEGDIDPNKVQYPGLHTVYLTEYTCPYCLSHVSQEWTCCPECGRFTPWGLERSGTP